MHSEHLPTERAIALALQNLNSDMVSAIQGVTVPDTSQSWLWGKIFHQ
jgi:hypothetical protein